MKNKADIPDMLAILMLFLWRGKKKKSKLNRESEAYWSKGLMILSSRFLPCLDPERSSPHLTVTLYTSLLLVSFQLCCCLKSAESGQLAILKGKL